VLYFSIKGHFATTAFATLFLNVSIIFGLLISKGAPKEKIVLTLSWAVIFVFFTGIYTYFCC